MSVKIYPVVKGADLCEDYEVYVNGECVELNTARVSAYPYNQGYNGQQRDKNQTELINFLAMQSDEEVELRIVPKIPSFAIDIRPRSSNVDAWTDANGVITVRVKGNAQFTVEPYGKNHALHVFIDPVSDYCVDFSSPDVLYFGAGEHDVGSIYLQSGQTLFIDEGAVVYATVYGIHADNIKILGRGILDNSRAELSDIKKKKEDGSAVIAWERRHSMNFVCCKNVEIDGIILRDPFVYAVNALSCEHIHINNLKIIGCWRYNSDGVHFANCIDGSLVNSFLRTFDDSVCVRGFANYDYYMFLNKEKKEDLSFVCRDILIRNCVVWNDWSKNIQIGTETYAEEIKNICFEDCKLIHTTGRAIAIWLVDQAKIHDVIFRNVLVEYDSHLMRKTYQQDCEDTFISKYEPDFGGHLIHFMISHHPTFSMIRTKEELGSISGVRLENVCLYGIQKPCFLFQGDNPNSLCENIELKALYWNGEPISKALFERQTEKNEYAKNIYLKD